MWFALAASGHVTRTRRKIQRHSKGNALAKIFGTLKDDELRGTHGDDFVVGHREFAAETGAPRIAPVAAGLG